MRGLLFILMLSFVGLNSFATDDLTQATNQISQAISKGDAAGVAKFFDSSVDMDILGNEGTHSKFQAEQILRNFFDKNKVSKFEVAHNTSSPSNNSKAFVGWLTANGKRYRLFVQLSNAGDKTIIQELSIKER